MASFIALYSGQTLASAKLVAVSSDASIVRDFTTRLLAEPAVASDDPAGASIESGRRTALRLIQEETSRAPDA
jgi:hypothetical protein